MVRLNGELTFKILVKPFAHVGDVSGDFRHGLVATAAVTVLLFADKAGADDVDNAEAGRRCNLEVWLVRELWEHVVGDALLHEENVLDVFAFEVDVFVRCGDASLEVGTDPRDEGLRFAFKIFDFLGVFIVNVEADTLLEVVRQVLDKICHGLEVFNVVLLDVFLDVRVQLDRKRMFLVEPVKHGVLL